MSSKKEKVKAKKTKTERHTEEPEKEEIIEKDPELNAIQEQINKINEEEETRISQVHAESIKKRQPLYKERNKICSKIPNFWLETLLKHPDISTLITEQDEQVLKHLKDISVEEFDEPQKSRAGFRVTFTFEVNEWFENTTLWKEFINEDSKIVSKASETKWKEGKDYTKYDSESVEPGKKRKKEQQPSFFTLFKADEEDDDVDDEFWDLLRGELWPDAVAYYYDQNPGKLEINDDDDDDDNDDDEIQEETENKEANENEEAQEDEDDDDEAQEE